MAEKVLVVTPYVALGKLIRQSLEKGGAYLVQVTESADEALALAAEATFSVAILDADVADQSIVALGQSLQATFPDLHLVVIPPNNDPNSPLLEGLAPQAFLSKPFYFPDLLQTIESLLSGTRIEAEHDRDAALTLSPQFAEETPGDAASRHWYEDPGQTADHLSALSLGPGVHEAIITCTGELWAYHGMLPEEAAEEIAAATIRYWEDGERGDLARFVTLKTNGCQYFMYATHLPGKLILSLIYDSNMPFSRIRSQTSQFARSVANPPPAIVEARRAPRSSVSIPEKAPQPISPLLDDSMPTDSDLPPLFDDIPSPDPVFQDISLGWVRENDESKLSVQSDTTQIESASGQLEGTPEPTEPEKLDFIAPAQPDASFESPPMMNPSLAYTSVLVPRLPHHTLKGELAAQLKRWMPQLSLAFGWNLESVVIDPQHLEWIVRLSPYLAPAKMVQAVRQHTSQRIFAAFTKLAQENPSGDFWAPGFFIASGASVLPAETVRDYIAQIRKQQNVAEF